MTLMLVNHKTDSSDIEIGKINHWKVTFQIHTCTIRYLSNSQKNKNKLNNYHSKSKYVFED